MIFDFDREIDRSDSDSVKWEKYRGRDVLPMWVADTDFAVAPQIQQALQQRAAHPVYGYTLIRRQLLDLLVARMQRLYQWDVDPAWIVMLPPVISAFYLACRARGKAGGCGVPAASDLPSVCEGAEFSRHDHAADTHVRLRTTHDHRSRLAGAASRRFRPADILL